MLFRRFSLMLVVAFSFTVTLSFCQLKEGFIIQTNGDYRYGQNAINEQTQHESVQFQDASKSVLATYTTETINGYGVIDGIKFIAKEISVNGATKKVFLKLE